MATTVQVDLGEHVAEGIAVSKQGLRDVLDDGIERESHALRHREGALAKVEDTVCGTMTGSRLVLRDVGMAS